MTGRSTVTSATTTALSAPVTIPANDAMLAAQWAATAGSPTITCACTLLERVGNYPA